MLLKSECFNSKIFYFYFFQIAARNKKGSKQNRPKLNPNYQMDESRNIK